MLNRFYYLLALFLFFQTLSAQTDFSFLKIQPERIADTISSEQLGKTLDWGGMVDEPITGQLVYAPEDLNGERILCDTPIVDFTNKIVLVDRGIQTCFFTTKAFQAQQLGAIAVIIRNPENSVVSMGKPDSYQGNVNIPVVMIPYDLGIDMEELLLEEDTVIVGFIPELSTKINVFQKDINLKIYPIPMKNFSLFELEGIKVKNGTLQLFDVMGRLVKEKPFSQNTFQLKRGLLPSGNYFFKISLDQFPIAATGLLQVID